MRSTSKRPSAYPDYDVGYAKPPIGAQFVKGNQSPGSVGSSQRNDPLFHLRFAHSAHTGIPLMILDWDIVQIEGAMLETWLPSVFRRLEELSRLCRARHGTVGAWIEDKKSGRHVDARGVDVEPGIAEDLGSRVSGFVAQVGQEDCASLSSSAERSPDRLIRLR